MSEELKKFPIVEPELTVAVLNYNRPKETELCLRTIRKFFNVDYNLILINTGGGDSDEIYSFYKEGLIDKLILRKHNLGCGLGTRECFNDFNLWSDYLIYVQCDQFAVRHYSKQEFEKHKELLKIPTVGHIDLAGNQGGGRYSERANLTKKSFYNSIPNGVGGPGPFGAFKWSEQWIQEFYNQNKVQFFSERLLFADNGKESIRQYPCGGIILQETDTKALKIIKPLKERQDHPNLVLTSKEWTTILGGEWLDGTIPENYKGKHSFKCWESPFTVKNINI